MSPRYLPEPETATTKTLPIRHFFAGVENKMRPKVGIWNQRKLPQTQSSKGPENLVVGIDPVRIEDELGPAEGDNEQQVSIVRQYTMQFPHRLYVAIRV